MAQPVNKRRLFWIVAIGLVAILGVSFWSGPAIEIPLDWLTQLWPDNPIVPAQKAQQPMMQPVPKATVQPIPLPPPAATVTPTAPAVASNKAPSIPAVPATPPKINTSTPAAASKPVMPIGANVAGQIIRDPFAAPAEAMVNVNPTANGSGATGVRGAAAGQSAAVPTLTGIIQGGGSRVAILRFGTISRSYREGESTGAFQVAAIDRYSVTLAGTGGNIVLTMGQ